MRQWASVVASLGVVAAAVIAMLPTSVPVEVGSGACGPSVVRLAAQERVEDPNRQDVIDRCETRAVLIVTIAALVVAIGLLAAVWVRNAERRQETQRRAARRRASPPARQTSS